MRAWAISVAFAAAACGGQAEGGEFARETVGASPQTETPGPFDSSASAANARASATPMAVPPSSTLGESSDPTSTVDGSPSDSTTQVFIAMSETGPIPEQTEPSQESNPTEVVTSITAAALVDEAGSCQVWLDLPDSELELGDVSVEFAGEPWPSAFTCDDGAVAWTIGSTEDGTWLVLCTAACDVVKATPDGDLVIRAKYWTTRQRVTR